MRRKTNPLYIKNGCFLVVCNPDTVIDFEGEDPVAFKDKSGHMNGIGKENVRVKNNTGFFYGIGKLSFWRYSNVELGPLLAIQIRFFPYGYSKNLMALVSNCNGSPIGATVDIRLNTSSNLATFKLSTNKQLNNFISLPYEVGQLFQHLILTLNFSVTILRSYTLK
jgi:hypothetical protein